MSKENPLFKNFAGINWLIGKIKMKAGLLLPLIFMLCLLPGFSCKKKNKQAVDDGVTPHDFLSADKYNSLTIEIDYVSGYAPTDATIQNMVTFLQNRLNKPNGVQIIKKSINSGAQSVYSLTDVMNIENNSRSQFTSGTTLSAYILFLDKDYYQNQGSQSKVLGITYKRSSVVIFENTIRQYCGGIGQPSAELLESTVIEHEWGHVMGLVNFGTNMVTSHQDGAHGSHCNNQNCLMYWSVETSDIISNILGTGSVPALDNNCLVDLRQNGGR